jgi:exopolyphosphatase / guanosine-5'-triphosphate,3'-diphosphate pyrophosphatase
MIDPAQGVRRIVETDLERVAEKLALLTPDQMVRRLHVHYTGAEGVLPALQTNLALARRFGDDTCGCPRATSSAS